jgi:nitrile hydratase beta subunit
MNGPQDLGGAQGFGPVEREADEPLFHGDWERRVLGLTLAMGASGAWNIDMSRHARERTPPADYLRSSYYEIWLTGLERLLEENGIATREELASGVPAEGGVRPPRKLMAVDVAPTLAKGASVARAPTAPAQFTPGDRVRTRLMHPRGHTRLPRYIGGRPGKVERVHGFHVFPDAHAHGSGEAPQWLYSVRFEARDLWGADAEPGAAVLVDCWESYLERVR